MALVRYETHEGVAVVTVDNPPVNALSPGVPGGIIASLKRGECRSRHRGGSVGRRGTGFYRRCGYTLFLETLA